MRILKSDILGNVIFYWQQTVDLPAYFYTLEHCLEQLNIRLLPVTSEDLMSLKKCKKVYLIIVRNSLESVRMYNELRRNYVESSMASGRVMIYDVSSFSKTESTSSKSKKISYKFFELPLEAETLSAKIANDYYNDKNLTEEYNQKDSWIKLPSLRMKI